MHKPVELAKRLLLLRFVAVAISRNPGDGPIHRTLDEFRVLM